MHRKRGHISAAGGMGSPGRPYRRLQGVRGIPGMAQAAASFLLAVSNCGALRANSGHAGRVIAVEQNGCMTYVNLGSLGTKPGRRDAVVSLLLAPMPGLREAGCLQYEVG